MQCAFSACMQATIHQHPSSSDRPDCSRTCRRRAHVRARSSPARLTARSDGRPHMGHPGRPRMMATWFGSEASRLPGENSMRTYAAVQLAPATTRPATMWPPACMLMFTHSDRFALPPAMQLLTTKRSLCCFCCCCWQRCAWPGRSGQQSRRGRDPRQAAGGRPSRQARLRARA